MKNDKKRLHKAIKTLAFVVLAAMMFSVKVSAESEKVEETPDALAEDIIEDFRQLLPDEMRGLADISKASDALGIEFLILEAMKTLSGEWSSFLSFFLLLVGITLMISVASACPGSVGNYCKGAASVISGGIIFEKIFSIASEVSESLSVIHVFFSGLIPLTASVNLLGLSSATASAQSIGMSMTLQIYSSVSGRVLLSVCGILLIISAVSYVEPELFQRLGKSIKSAFILIVGLMSTLIGVTFSLQSMVTSHADTGVIRTARYAISGMIPIVGGAVSTALGTLAGSVSYAKGVIGGGAIAVIIAVMCAPLLTLLVYRCTLNVALFFSEVCSVDGATGLFTSFLYAFDTLVAVYAMTVIVYVAEIAVFLKGGAGFAW